MQGVRMVPYPPCSICSSFSPTTYYSLSWQTTMWYWECAVKRGSWGAPCVELQGVTPIQLLDAMLTHPCVFSAPLTHGFITTVNNGCSHINHHQAEEKRPPPPKKKLLLGSLLQNQLRFKLVRSLIARKYETWIAWKIIWQQLYCKWAQTT